MKNSMRARLGICLVAALGTAALVGVAPATADPLTGPFGSAPSLRALVTEQQAQLDVADGVSGDCFGSAVAISGDTAVVVARDDDVGANSDQGSAYVFVRNGTTWTQQAQLTAIDGITGDGFGCAVAISGDTVVIGAYLDDVGANVDQGSAYVFVRNGTTWTQQAQLIATDGASGDSFGSAAAISGDTVVVGAHDDDVGANSDQGSAYVFVRSGTAWSQQAQLIAGDGATGDSFGCAVAISGDTVVVGARDDDVGAHLDEGSAYVFVRSGTAWSQQKHLTSGDGGSGFAGDSFGCAVALSGETAAVGAEGSDTGIAVDQGSVQVFNFGHGYWSHHATLTAADGVPGDKLGSSVAISGETVVAGTLLHDVGANSDQGSAYVFAATNVSVGEYGTEITWSQQAQLTVADGAAGDSFGSAVAISGATAVVGAMFDDVGANSDQGSAYIHSLAKPDKSSPLSPKGLIRSRTPTFKWTAAVGAATYEVCIYKGTRLIKKRIGIGGTSWKCTTRLPRGVYLTWKVRARNVAGAGLWSAKPRFKVR